MKTDTYLASKPRYEILDGLRGVAAMIVVAFHLFETYSPGPKFQILNHGYLAVDFFFVLSGFVIGYAYDDRWNKMTTWGFFKRRLVRLHPMIIAGMVMGAALFYFGASPEFPAILQTPWWLLLSVLGLSMIMYPMGPSLDIRGWHEMSPLNGAAWSIMFEYCANIIYALIIRHFNKLTLFIFCALSSLMTIDIAMNIDFFGILEARKWAEYTLIGGFGLAPDQLYIGFGRLLFPFFTGLLIARCGKYIRIPNGFWWCSLFISLTLVMPYIGNPETKWADGLYNVIAVIVIFPLIVAMGAGNCISGKKTMAVCRFLGGISYPLYITHYPWIYVQMAWAANHPDAPLGAHITISVAIFFIVIGLSYAFLKLYDEPVREWLKNKVLRRQTAPQISK